MEQSTDDTQRGSVDSCPESNQSWTNDVAALLSIGTICLAEVPLAAWALASMIANPSRQYTTLPCFFVMMAKAEKFTTVRLIGSCFWAC